MGAIFKPKCLVVDIFTAFTAIYLIAIRPGAYGWRPHRAALPSPSPAAHHVPPQSCRGLQRCRGFIDALAGQTDQIARLLLGDAPRQPPGGSPESGMVWPWALAVLIFSKPSTTPNQKATDLPTRQIQLRLNTTLQSVLSLPASGSRCPDREGSRHIRPPRTNCVDCAALSLKDEGAPGVPSEMADDRMTLMVETDAAAGGSITGERARHAPLQPTATHKPPRGNFPCAEGEPRWRLTAPALNSVPP